MKESKSLQVCK